MKVLLIGSSFSAMPFLKEIRRQGAEVWVIGKYQDDPCHQYADHSIYEDYSDPERLAEVCDRHGFDYLVPTCNDYSYVAGATVAHARGLPGFDTPDVTAILHTKDRFRQFCQEVGVPAPRIYGEVTEGSDLSGVASQLDGPALVKPVDSFSGRGVELVLDAGGLAPAVQSALAMSRGKRAVIEQFVDGALHSHTAFVADGKIVWHEFVDEFCEVYRYQVDRSAFPSRLAPDMRAAVHASMETVVERLGLCDGLLHTQFIASATEFWIIESMRRCPGDLYGHHFQFSVGYDYEAQFVAGFMGRRPAGPPPCDQAAARIERRVLSTSAETAFFAVSVGSGADEAVFVPLKDSGQSLKPAPFDKAGILFLIGKAPTSREQLWAVAAGMKHHELNR